ncbi:MAG: hypothetical protein FWB72_01400 [Firmicutes bacterium]|nr:hypothetical protein [Bacillota bacterium]
MLKRNERAVMKIIYKASKATGNSVLAPDYILDRLNPRLDVDNNKLEDIIEKLVLEEYIDFVRAEKKGEVVFVFNLLHKGIAFERELENERRSRVRWIAVTIIGAVISTLIGLAIRQVLS